jgi:hypothetical protein
MVCHQFSDNSLTSEGTFGTRRCIRAERPSTWSLVPQGDRHSRN